MTEGIIDTADGVFLVRDIGASYEDQRAASAATRIPNSRAGRMLGAAGGVLQVRCGHQRSRPRVRMEIDDSSPHRGPDWQWAEPLTLTLPSGTVVVDDGLSGQGPRLEVPAGAYTVLVGHRGRAEMQEAAVLVSMETVGTAIDDTMARWATLAGIEQYLILLTSSAWAS
jgi:hypothetical protein